MAQAQNYHFGPKAITAVTGFQKTLARFPRVERLSMLRYLANAENAVGVVAKTTIAGSKIARASTAIGQKKLTTKRWLKGSRVRAVTGRFASNKTRSGKSTRARA